MQGQNKPGDIINCIIEGIKEKKGEEIVKLDLKNLEQAVTDYFIICHANSNRQVDAIADHVEKNLRKQYQEHVLHKEGTSQAEWILLDYANIVVHVFKKDVRNTYKLEELWGDGELTRISDLKEQE
ncbi:Ribosomal silencing factor RsfS [Salinivirga cyanobacteriivorans]|uniref:Ribosomal silencing factor RsfS n=2 Tax=Salinivirga cyanobacteriivorans TaxID=1307839 RepID=A0A0S2HXY1_9BACT|nr:Ribosomal silencing factor RsfS [Salinivirga cyanobacteriivorans]